MKKFDLAVVGAGILGLAHAWYAARAGKSVLVLERSPRSVGATVRNFGMLAIIAQAEGPQLESALYNLSCWQEISKAADIPLHQAGCLFLARHEQELAVLEEFAGSSHPCAADCKMLLADDLHSHAHYLASDGLIGGMWSPDAWKLDQRNAPEKIAEHLQKQLGVTLRFSTEVTDIRAPVLNTSNGVFEADEILICGGHEFSTLYPDAFRASGVGVCQLQMMRTASRNSDVASQPFIVGGLSLTRYEAFASCRSRAALVELQTSLQSDAVDQGVHVIVARETDGSMTIGDSHAYGEKANGTRIDAVDQIILGECAKLVTLPNPKITERWLGHYAHLPGSEVLRLSPDKNVTALVVTNGQGMTHSFSIARQTISDDAIQG